MHHQPLFIPRLPNCSRSFRRTPHDRVTAYRALEVMMDVALKLNVYGGLETAKSYPIETQRLKLKTLLRTVPRMRSERFEDNILECYYQPANL